MAKSKGKASAAGPKAQQKLAAEEREKQGAKHTSHEASRFLKGQRIDPRRIDGKETVADLIDGTYLAYNAARLREACQLFTDKMLKPDVTVGLSITGALTPAGLGMSALIPLIESAGGVITDWQGGPCDNGGDVLACGDPALHATLLQRIAAG